MPGPARPRTVTPQPRGEAFTNKVLEATLAQLAKVGFERLSIPGVAEFAGVNKTSIYRRWPGKHELVRDALGAAMSHAEQSPDTGDLRADLLSLAAAVAAFTQSRVGTAVIRILLAEGGNPALRAIAQAAYGDAARHAPWMLLARAVERGELKKDLDPSLLLFTIAGAIVHRVFVEQREATGAFLEQLVDLLLFGATVQKPQPKR